MTVRSDPQARRSLAMSARRSVITIALADQHHLIRESVRCLFETKKDFKVVGEVADGLKVVASSSVASREY